MIKNKDITEKVLFIVDGFHYNKWDRIDSFELFEDAQELIAEYLRLIKINPKDFNWQKFRILEQRHTSISETTVP